MTVAQGAAASHYESADEEHEASGWAIGFILFAGVMMVLAGGFQTFTGLVALFENEFYVSTRNYLFQFDATAWGWIHLIFGILVMVAGFAVMAGQTWARVVAIILAALSALANFTFIPYYPFWALTIIAIDIFVIWALAVHGRDVRDFTH
ncbi:DUF7144 family membrane protein [Kribbella sp. CA-245084]|uniref:DUF7144 family membrane protein n=1 Tax=Kribbella sp. CA-245084 TaxID=3239940 RepID=UPI003D93DC19